MLAKNDVTVTISQLLSVLVVELLQRLQIQLMIVLNFISELAARRNGQRGAHKGKHSHKKGMREEGKRRRMCGKQIIVGHKDVLCEVGAVRHINWRSNNYAGKRSEKRTINGPHGENTQYICVARTVLHVLKNAYEYACLL